jgi:hypothetical protein
VDYEEEDEDGESELQTDIMSEELEILNEETAEESLPQEITPTAEEGSTQQDV